jgi:hypothetical protein
MIVLAIATTLASGAFGRAAAAPPVSCEKKSAPSKLTCETFFTMTFGSAVTLRLLPGTGYTGALQARITQSGLTKVTVAAYYVAGQAAPITNLRTEEVAVLPAGTYRVFVEAGAPLTPCTSADGPCQSPCSVSAALCAMSLPKVAAGEYTAEVVEAEI